MSLRSYLQRHWRKMTDSPVTRTRRMIRDMALANSRGDARRAVHLANRLQGEGLYLSPKAKLAEDVKFPHPTAIVIGEGCVVEEGVTLYQSVTLGGARKGDWQANNYPTIGANSTLFAGAVVAGAVRIGRNCTIGANAVVLTDIPDGATAVGAPARVVNATAKTTDWSRPAARLMRSAGTQVIHAKQSAL